MEKPLDGVPADLEGEIHRMLQEIGQLNARMKSDRAEIEALKAESRALQHETRAMLADLKVLVRPC